MDDRAFTSLIKFLERVPAMDKTISCGKESGHGWWVKFSLDIHHPRAWQVVQEFGHVLNYSSLDEQLPTVFKPVSPPPYMNGGPEDFLSWVIESESQEFRPGTLAKWLEGRLPRPVDDDSEWGLEE